MASLDVMEGLSTGLEAAPGPGPSEGDICAAQAWDSITGARAARFPGRARGGSAARPPRLWADTGPEQKAQGGRAPPFSLN